MIRPVKVDTRPEYRIWVEFSDGVAGEIDLSDLEPILITLRP